LLIEGMQPGGQLTITSDVENYPGFEHGILGPELMDVMRKQVARFGTDFLLGDATRVDLSQRPFAVFVGEARHDCKTLIIATGARANLLDLPSEAQLMGRGVSACATCDGPFFKGETLIVVGGGDTAMEEATYLTRFAKQVVIVHRRHEFRASKIMLARAQKNDKIRFLTPYSVEEILDTKAGKVTGGRLKHRDSGKEQIVDAGGVFVAIGHTPNTEIFKGQLPLDENGYIKVDGFTSKTTIPGVFAAGDVRDHVYRQAVSAAGTGCMAAIDAERFLEQQGG